MLKRCSKCGNEKPIIEFTVDKRRKDGHFPYCKLCKRAESLKSRLRDPERAREATRPRNRKYRIIGGERVRQYKRDWRSANPEKRLGQERRYRRKHGEKVRTKNSNQQARKRKRNAPGTFKDADIQAQYALQGGLCFWCSATLTDKWSIDHVIPVNRGGPNWAWNLVCSCLSCNSSKHDKLPWIEWQPRNPLQPSHPALDEYQNQDKQNE